MVKKKSGSRRKTTGKRKSKPVETLSRQLIRSLWGIGLLVAVVAAAAALLHYFTPGGPPAGTPPAGRSLPAKKSDFFEIYPKRDVPPRPPRPAQKEIAAGKRPQIAIIIDDLGEDRGMAEKFIGLGQGLTFSLLPTGTHQQEIARKARAAGVEMMLHLPMEPLEYPTVKPGKGALLMSMTPDELIEQLNRDIEAVPGAKGVNNHMGSKMTAESDQMHQIFSILKKRNLFFIDSRTTPDTVCGPSARLFNVHFAQRDVFIDNIQKPAAIRKQLDKLVLEAGRHGEAVGIGHPHPATYRVLQKVLPQLKKKYTLVPASQLVHPLG